MTYFNGLSILILVLVGVAVLAGLGSMVGSLAEYDEDNLKAASQWFLWSLVAAVVFFAGSFFPAW